MYDKIEKLVDSSKFQNFIMVVIIFNGITMGLETSKSYMADYGTYFHMFDKLVIVIFTIEILLRIYVYRMFFFKDGWSLFDFSIVAIAFFPSGGSFEVLRILRVLRLLRLVTVMPQMRKIVMALVGVMPGIGAIAGLLMLLFYIFAIMATNLYADTFPEWFGSLSASIYTLFQIMTLESWSMGIVRPVMEVHPYAWIFFVPYILIATFIMINLIIAVVVDAMSDLTKKEEENIIDGVKVLEDGSAVEIKKLQMEIQELKEILLKKV